MTKSEFYLHKLLLIEIRNLSELGCKHKVGFSDTHFKIEIEHLGVTYTMSRYRSEYKKLYSLILEVRELKERINRSILQNHKLPIYSVEVFNLNTNGVFCGQPVPKGCLGIKTGNIKHKPYKQVGNVFYSESSGIVSAYEHKEGTTNGFAGRKITLLVEEPSKLFRNKKVIVSKEFNGSLWDTADAWRTAEKDLDTELFRVGIREKKENLNLYTSYHVTKEFMDRLSNIVVLGEPKQSPLV